MNLDNNPHLTRMEVVHERLMQDPVFKRNWEKRAPIRAVRKAILEERIKQKLTQEELAKKIDSNQSAIARLENHNASSSTTLKTLIKLADAFGKKLEVRFVDQ